MTNFEMFNGMLKSAGMTREHVKSTFGIDETMLDYLVANMNFSPGTQSQCFLSDDEAKLAHRILNVIYEEIKRHM